MERNFFIYFWRASARDQTRVLGLVLASLPFYFASLSLPKAIVNGPITGAGFETEGARQPFLTIGLPWPFGETVLFEGVALDRVGLLFALSALFLVLVFVNGGFKLAINTLKGRMGEVMLQGLRFELIDRVLRFPPQEFRRRKPSEIATMINSEVEPLGGFIGDAFVQPAYLGGLALTALLFILVQNVWLGGVAAIVVVLQALMIPRLRRPILRLGRRRQLAARAMAGRVGEIVDGIVEIHVNDTSNFERFELNRRLSEIFRIRFEIYKRKYAIKFLNNFLFQLTPFVFYALGGWLAIRGTLDIGQLVAVIAAYKELPGPVRDLINWDQQRLDAQIKYEQIADQFDPERLMPPALQAPGETPPLPEPAEVRIDGLVLADDAGARLLEVPFLAFGLAERVALVGPPGAGKEALAAALARLVLPERGRVMLGGHDLAALPERITGRALAYVGPDPYFWPVSVEENLAYVLRRAPPEDGGGGIDYAAADARDAAGLRRRMAEVIEVVDLTGTLFAFGLKGRIDPRREGDLVARLKAASRDVAERLAESDARDLVELFDPARYNANATVAENILFGSTADPALSTDALPAHPHFREVLRAAGLEDRLLDMGLAIARTMVELFADLPPDHPFFEQFSFIAAADLPETRALLKRVSEAGGVPPEEARDRLLALPLKYVESRHRLGLIDAELMNELLLARALFRDRLPEGLEDRVDFFDPERYNPAASVEDNLLRGRIVYGRANAAERVNAILREVLDARGLADEILRIGLAYPMGIGGRRLGLGERQRLAVARALLKRPRLLVASEALSVLDPATEDRILSRILDLAAERGFGVVWALPRAPAPGAFDRVLRVEGGRIVTGAEGRTAQGLRVPPRPAPAPLERPPSP